jgi:hypothetical protein
MSWKATAMVKELTHALDGSPIPRDAKLVYQILADYHNTARRAAWPAVAELCRLCIMSERHCWRQLAWLEDHGEILREGVRGGAGRTTSYRIIRLDGDGVNPDGQSGLEGPESLPRQSGKIKNFPAENPDTTLPPSAANTDKTLTARSGAIRKPVNRLDLIEPVEPHAFGAAMKVWIAIKTELQEYLSEEEWQRWVRPALLTKLMGDKVYLVGFPPNGRIIEAAERQKPLVQKLARNHGLQGIVFSRYPDEFELNKIRELYPEQWQSFAPALQAKVGGAQ